MKLSIFIGEAVIFRCVVNEPNKLSPQMKQRKFRQQIMEKATRN